MGSRGDGRAEEEGLPQPGTEEPEEAEGAEKGDATEGPGNVSVDEPTAPALSPDEPERDAPGEV
jgi:hypothetical protein